MHQTKFQKNWSSGHQEEVKNIKGIGSILFLKNGLKIFAEKTIKSSQEIYYEVCTAVPRCFPNILDVMVLENVNLSADKIGRPPFWSNNTDWDFYHHSVIYTLSGVYFNRTLISYVHGLKSI
jgi:hypothetical protein